MVKEYGKKMKIKILINMKGIIKKIKNVEKVYLHGAQVINNY